MPNRRRQFVAPFVLAAPLLLGAAEGPGPAPVTPAGPVVAELVVEGTNRYHPERLRGQLGTRAGAVLDRATLAEDLRYVNELGAFASVESDVELLEGGQVRVVLRVVELPYVGEVRLVGLDWFSHSGAEEILLTRRGTHLDPLVLERDRRNLVDYFRLRNHLHVKVASTVAVDPDSGIGSVVFTIDRGVKVEVARVVFPGLPDAVVREFALSQMTNKPGAPFTEDMLGWDAGALTEFLRLEGWLEARVNRFRYEFFDALGSFDPAFRHGGRLAAGGQRNDRVVVVMEVEPGERYQLGDVRFVDHTVVSEEELREAFALPAGHPFVRRDLEIAKADALRLIRNLGYARAAIREDRVVDAENHTVDLVLHVFEGDIYRIGRIDPVGNTVTKDQVIRRAMTLEPGDLWNDDQIAESRRQVLRAGVFRNEPTRPLSITPVFDESRPGRADLKVNVDEDDTGRINFQVGYSSGSGFQGSVSVSERNFDPFALLRGEGWRGAGHLISANASWSADRQSFGVNWTNPRVMDSPYFLTLGFQRTDNTSIDWDEVREVSQATVGRYFLNYDLLLSVGYRYTDLKISSLQQDASDQAINQGPGSFHLNSFVLRQAYDRRDNPSMTTEGFRLSLTETINGGLLTASHPYFEIEFVGEAWVPLYEADLGGVTFLRLRQKFGHLEPFGDNTEVPFYDRYYGGGPAPRHRGFDSGDLGPRETNILGVRSRPGGTDEWLTTAEVSIPLQGTNRGLRMVLFADVGQIWGDVYDEIDPIARRFLLTDNQIATLTYAEQVRNAGRREGIDPGDLRYAVGIGFRLPAFLPLSFDFAWLLDAESDEEQRQFHITLSGGF